MPEAARSDESIFASAAEMPLDDRAPFLKEACHDSAQRARIEALLASHEHGGSFLQKPPLQPVTIDHVPLVETAGSVIDRYKLLQQIGEGGFGVVYMAEQKEPVRRKVALKVIKLGMDSREIIARFEAERQALAMMDHPNIAKVFDAGTTENGRPYFVMELVKGVPIAEFCDKNQLAARDRLNLFAQVCHAVQHAHQKGIIHRDLKPSNILVTLHDGKPVPKVIDFGVAKAINQELTEKTMFTAYGHMVGTPQYMSPEQAEMSGLDVDTRSDVYSLGVLLYELLTGTTPLEAKRLRSAGYAEMQRLIREEEPPRPSTRVSTLGEQLSVVARDRQCDPGRLSALLRGELDWIVLKALEKDRTRRYESATALAKDVERYLQDEPVEACPPTLGYRLRKIVRKNRVAVFATLAIVIASLLAAAGQTVNLMRARAAEADAVEARMAESVQREETGKERDAALEAKRDATRKRNDAIEAGKKLQLAQDDLRSTQYGWDMQMMPYAWDAGNVTQALQLLNRHKPDLRHFEWHYWDRQLHAERRTIKFPTVDVEVSSLTTAPNGAQAASLMSAINVWVLSADGTRVLTSVPGADVRTTGGKPVDQLLKVWDLGTGKELLSHVLQRSQTRARISHAVFSSDGARVAVSWGSDERIVPNPDGTFTSNRRVRILEVASGKTLLDYQEPKGDASHWNLSPDGKRFAVIVKGTGVRIVPPPVKVWDVDTGKELFTVHGDASGTFAPPFSGDSKRIAAIAPGTDHRTLHVKIWDSDTGNEVGQWKFEGDAAPPLVFSPDGVRLAAVAKTIERGAVNGTAAVNLWETSTGKELCAFPLSAAAAGWWDRPQPFFNRDGTRLAVTLRQSGTLLGPETKVFDTVAKKELFSFTTKHVNDITIFAPDGNRIAAAEGRLVLIRDATTGQVKQTFKGHLTKIMALAFRPNGRGLCAIESDGTMKEWDTQSGDSVVIDGPSRTGVGAAALSPDGRRLAVIAPSIEDGVQSVKVSDTGTGKELYSLTVPATALTQMTHHLTFSADGRRLGLARAPRGGTSNPRFGKPTEKIAGDLTLWDVLTAKLLTTAELPAEPLTDFCLSPDGSRAALALRGGDGVTIPKLIVCDTATGRLICEGKPVAIGPGISFSPDGQRIAGTVRLPVRELNSISTGNTATLIVWDAANGKELLSFDTRGVGDSPVWDREGRRIAIGLKDQLGMGILRIYDATSGSLLSSVEDTAGPAGNRAVAAIAFSPDGKRIAAHLGGSVRTSRAEPEVKLWDAATGKELLALKTLAAGANLAFSSDGHRLIEAGYLPASFNRNPPPTRPITVRSWDATPRP